MNDFDVIVIGAGAAGLMCAQAAGHRGRRVLVLDHGAEAGAKILISGGGRCNFTNLNVGPGNYLSDNPLFCKSALERFSQHDFIAMVDRHRIRWDERSHGQLFCTESARRIVAMLLAECAAARVTIRLNTQITEIVKADRFRVDTSGGSVFAPSLVLATGGLSLAKIGASDFAHQAARYFGLNVTPLRPGLVPLRAEGADLELASATSGIALDGIARLGKKSFREAILFTHRGLSGPAILQISSYWQPGQTIELNLLPDRDVADFLMERKESRPKAELKTVLGEILPNRMAQLLAGDTQDTMARLPGKMMRALGASINRRPFRPSCTEGYGKAEVTLGGIDTDGLCPQTMEAKAVPGLYVVGEAMDVTGWLGGYNFQWAWSSGWCAGQAV